MYKAEKLNISENEFKIYTEILKNPGTTILEVSKRVSIPRATIYTVVEDLMQKGFIRNVQGSKKQYYAQDPDKLVKYAEKSLNQVTQELESLSDQMPMLKLFFNKETLLKEGDMAIESHTYKNDEMFASMTEIVGSRTGQMWGISDSHYIDVCFDMGKGGKIKENEYSKVVMRNGEKFVIVGPKERALEAKRFLKNNPKLRGRWEPRWIDESRFDFKLNINLVEDVMTLTPTGPEVKSYVSHFIRSAQITTPFRNLIQFLWESAEKI